MACGCQIICSSAGGTKEIAGPDAVIVKEEEWDYSPVELYNPPPMDFAQKAKNIWHNNNKYDMLSVCKKYYNFMRGNLDG